MQLKKVELDLEGELVGAEYTAFEEIDPRGHEKMKELCELCVKTYKKLALSQKKVDASKLPLKQSMKRPVRKRE